MARFASVTVPRTLSVSDADSKEKYESKYKTTMLVDIQSDYITTLRGTGRTIKHTWCTLGNTTYIVQRICKSQGAGRVARLSLKPLKGTSTSSLVLYHRSTLHLPDFGIKISRTSVDGHGHDHFSPDKGTDQI